MEVRTQPLEPSALVAQLQAVCELCAALDPVGLDVSYGWACDLEDDDDLYVDHRIGTSALSDFVESSRARGVFTLGGSDLYIKGASVHFSFTLCHESDIHFESHDESLVNRVTQTWAASGLTFYPVA